MSGSVRHVGTDGCLFLAVGVDDGALRARVDRLTAFYAPLGAARPALRRTDGAHAVIGALTLAGAEPAADGPWQWGTGAGGAPDTDARLLAAGAAELGGLTGPVALFGLAGQACRVATGLAGPVVLYAARNGDAAVWATHAVAAAILAGLDLRVDAGVLPEYLAFEFAGGERTLLAGVRAVAPGTVVDVVGDACREWRPAGARWELVDECDAQREAEAAFVATLAAAVGDAADVALALTSGADSRVVAAGLLAAGVRPRAFTWGEPGWPDVEGAAAIARAMGFPHEIVEVEYTPDDALVAAADRNARWCDGVFALAPAERRLPAAAVLAGGMGGETGRAFYWRPHARLVPDPGRAVLVEQLRATKRLGAASPDARDAVERAASSWVDAALAEGVAGWRALDVVYADQRVRRWGRAQIPCSPATFVGAFTPLEVARRLVSLPLEDRIGDGFHRAFMASRWPGLVPPAPAPPPRRRRGIPAVAGRLRRLVAREPAARPPDPALAAFWAERPATSRFIREDVLGSELLTRAIGETGRDRLLDGWRAGDPQAVRQALLATGPVLLERALRAAGAQSPSGSVGTGDLTSRTSQ